MYRYKIIHSGDWRVIGYFVKQKRVWWGWKTVSGVVLNDVLGMSGLEIQHTVDTLEFA